MSGGHDSVDQNLHSIVDTKFLSCINIGGSAFQDGFAYVAYCSQGLSTKICLGLDSFLDFFFFSDTSGACWSPRDRDVGNV